MNRTKDTTVKTLKLLKCEAIDMCRLSYFIAVFALAVVPLHVFAADKPIKAFILAGQSNMVGYGDSTELPEDRAAIHLRNGTATPYTPER